MKLAEIRDAWTEDAKIDSDKLDEESNKGPALHAKYFSLYVTERLVLKKLRQNLKLLELEKYKFLTEGPTQEQDDKGWVLPARGKIMKSEVSKYLEADSDIQEAELRVENQACKVDFLYSIIEAIKNRGFSIKNAIEFIRFQTGY